VLCQASDIEAQPTKKNNRTEHEVLEIRERCQDGGGGKGMKGRLGIGGRFGEVAKPGGARKTGELFTESTFETIGGDVVLNSST